MPFQVFAADQTFQLTRLRPDRQYTYQFSPPNGQLRIYWSFVVSDGFVFIREVSYTVELCELLGKYHRFNEENIYYHDFF